jgi:hypothetical protein
MPTSLDNLDRDKIKEAVAEKSMTIQIIHSAQAGGVLMFGAIVLFFGSEWRRVKRAFNSGKFYFSRVIFGLRCLVFSNRGSVVSSFG